MSVKGIPRDLLLIAIGLVILMNLIVQVIRRRYPANATVGVSAVAKSGLGGEDLL